MGNKVAAVMGALFILVGVTGFALNNFAGAHLTPTHNIIHLVSGSASLYIGIKGSRSAARLFCYVFGFLYLGLAVVGYWLGYDHGASYLPPGESDNAVNENMFRMIPGMLELGTVDHLIHITIGAVYLIAAGLTRTARNMTEYLEGNSD